MTNSKVRNSDSAHSICFSQVFIKFFTFLMDTADKEIYYILIVFYSPNTLIQTGQTNTHTYIQTNINRVLMIKISIFSAYSNVKIVNSTKLKDLI